jgi:hypothetical protein
MYSLYYDIKYTKLVTEISKFKSYIQKFHDHTHTHTEHICQAYLLPEHCFQAYFYLVRQKISFISCTAITPKLPVSQV